MLPPGGFATKMGYLGSWYHMEVKLALETVYPKLAPAQVCSPYAYELVGLKSLQQKI